MGEFSGVSVVLEGLDGVGKSTVAALVAEQLGAVLRTTPPPGMRPYRSFFDRAGGGLRQGYYMVGNFQVGQEVEADAAAGRATVVDRFYASTQAYPLARAAVGAGTGAGEGEAGAGLPPAGAEVYAWPAELVRPTAMFVLVLGEEERQARRSSRTAVPETAEEALLRETPALCAAINEAYRRLGCREISAAGPPAAVADRVVAALRQVLAELAELAEPGGRAAKRVRAA